MAPATPQWPDPAEDDASHHLLRGLARFSKYCPVVLKKLYEIVRHGEHIKNRKEDSALYQSLRDPPCIILRGEIQNGWRFALSTLYPLRSV